MFEPATRKPKVQLVIDKDAYNMLIQVLENNAATEYSDSMTIDRADKLLGKIEQYVRLFVTDDGRESAEIRFFESEASELIWQLIFHASIDMPDNDFYTDLKIKREREVKSAD